MLPSPSPVRDPPRSDSAKCPHCVEMNSHQVDLTEPVGGLAAAAQSSLSQYAAKPDLLEVTFDNSISPVHTVLKILSGDRPGLLFHLCECLGAAGLSLHSNSSTSRSDKTGISVFCITEHGQKVVSEARQRVIRELLSAAITDTRATSRAVLSSNVSVEVCCNDRTGLLSDFATAFSQLGISIVHAKISTTDAGFVTDVFWIRQHNNTPVPESQFPSIAKTLKEATRDPKSTVSVREPNADLPEDDPDDDGFVTGRTEQIDEDVKVRIVNGDGITRIEVYCEDRTGLLYDLSHVISSVGVVIVRVRITTGTDTDSDSAPFFTPAHGTFYVTDSHGLPLKEGSSTVTRLREKLIRTCSANAVTLDAHTSQNLVVLQVSGLDRSGLLIEILAVLAAHAVSVQHARISTHRGWASLLFFLHPAPPERLAAARAAVQQILRIKT
eukprot:TRINITY_DN3655_c0_g1_i1.p1 TRINITY_DN3655_c0_g1~~TRINITY_DN3655_c0_g1_i1.p1  ORF type:complete len:453 (-),score=92.40 TRINITY_DN3655_c0_g1_i1:40-1359(-)